MGLSISNQLRGSTGLSVGLGLSRGNRLYFSGFGGGAPFSPAELFANGEPGGWYQPSDLTTLFQDASGTLPVTEVEQPVGLMLDKSRNTVGTNGAKRVNLVSWSQAFNDAVWTKSDATITPNDAIAPDGTTTADKLVETATTAEHAVFQSPSYTSGLSYTYSVAAKAAERNFVYIQFGSAAFGTPTGAWFNLSTGTVGATANSPTTSITSLGSGWYRCSITKTATVTSTAPSVIETAATDGVKSYLGVAGSGIHIWGADIRLTSEAATLPTYQRIDADWPSTMAGAHLTQSTSTARPVLSARVNLLTQTEAFNEAVWTKSKITVTANQATSPFGGNTADLAVVNNGLQTLPSIVHQLSSGQSSTNVTLKCYVKKAGASYASIGWIYTGSIYCGASFNLDTQQITRSAAAGGFTIVGTPTITSINDGWYLISITATTPSTAAYSIFPGIWPRVTPWTSGPLDADDTGDGTSGIYIWGADLRVANDTAAPVYQRVGVGTPGSSTAAGSSDYTVTGFPLYLRFDGTDDAMASASVNFTSTDAMSVFAGVRKLSDANIGAIVELSAAPFGPTTNTFGVQAPQGNIPRNMYSYFAGGTSLAIATTGTIAPTAPDTSVITGQNDISADTISLRLNGVFINSASTDQGTGNFANQPLYVGARGGTSVPFNGRLYSLIVRGAATSDTQIAQTESYVSTQMGGGYVPTSYDYLVDANGDQLTDASGNALYTIPLYS